MSTPAAPSPPAAAPPEPSPPPPPEPGLFYCHECGATAFLHGALLPAPPSSPLHVCPTCQRGFLEERPRSSSPPPPPPPPPHLAGSGSSSSSELSDDSDDSDDDIELASENYAATREYFRSVVDRSSRYDGPDLGDAAAAVAMSALRQRGLAIVRQRALLHQPALAAARGGEPPAPAASIAALPTVEVAEPAAACAICKDDLPLASQARKLPCAHLYHSPCIVTWLEMHNSCPVCRFRIPSAAAAGGPEPEGAAPEEEGSSPTRITIRFTTTARRRRHVLGDAAAAGPVSVSATQLAQAFTEDAAAGPANSGETVSSDWPPHPESDAVMSEAREGDGLFD